jgi:hypothetical protein
MPYRRILLHIMLWSLAAGAVLGAIAVLASQGQTFWRICGTTLITAAAAGLLIPVSRLIDKPLSRPSGLLGMSLIIIEFFLSLAMTWELYPSWTEEQLALTLVFLPVCGTAAAIMLRIARGDPRGRWAGTAGVLIAIACFVIIMGALWIAPNWPAREKPMNCSGALASFGLIAVACLAGGSPRPNLRNLLTAGRALGVAAAATGAGIAIYAICFDIDTDSWVFRAITSLATVIAHANLCLLVPLSPTQQWVRVVTVLAALCTAISLNIAMYSGAGPGHVDLAWRAASASGIITACGSIALLVLAAISRRVPSETRELAAVAELKVVCPGCGRKQALPVGHSECPTCRLQFDIRVVEPRCPKCDYLLFMLKSDRCPECGQPLSPPAGAPDSAASGLQTLTP